MLELRWERAVAEAVKDGDESESECGLMWKLSPDSLADSTDGKGSG